MFNRFAIIALYSDNDTRVKALQLMENGLLLKL